MTGGGGVAGAGGVRRAVAGNVSARRRVAPLALCALTLCVGVRPAPGAGSAIDAIVIEGNQRVDAEAIRVRLQATVGAPFDREVVASDIRTVYSMGFFEQVEVDWSDPDGTGVLTVRVVERPWVRSVRVEGAEHVKTEEIEAALKVRPHTVLDTTKVREGMAAAKQVYEEEGYLDVVIAERTVDVGNNEVELIYDVDERERVWIRKITFEGNEAFSDRKLRGVMATKKKGWFSRFTGSGILKRDVLKVDGERVGAFYFEEGYITARVDEPQVERRENGLYITIKVDEGEQFRVGKVDINGVEGVPLDVPALVKELDLEPGRVFSNSAMRRDVERVTDALADFGYANAEVGTDHRIRADERLVDVVFMVNKGRLVYIDRIEIVGNTKTRDKVVRREIEVKEQQLFSATNIRRSREHIQRLGFFREVEIKTRPGVAEDRLDMVVEVAEGQTGAFSAGAGFSSADSLLFNVRVSEINLFGRGQRVVLNADFGTLRRNFLLNFTEPYLLDTPLSLGVDAFNWQLEFEDFTREGTGIGLRFLYPLVKLGVEEIWGFPLADVRVGWAYRLEDAKISDVSPSAVTDIRIEEGSNLISSVTPRLRRDTLNHAFDPTGGSMQDLSIELAGLGGDTKFVNAILQARWFYSFWDSPTLGIFTYSAGGTLGWGRGEEGESGDELPLFERYFPGGLNSVRGYKVRTLGPRESQKNTFGKVQSRSEVGGSQQIVINNELIFPIIKGLGVKGVVFFDMGQAYTAKAGIDVTDLQYAAGAAVRWLSPFGPLQMGIGFPLNPREDDDASVILFSFGGPLQ
jgi:outer membrane protein insertion porin family